MCRKGLDFEIKSWTILQKFLLKKMIITLQLKVNRGLRTHARDST